MTSWRSSISQLGCNDGGVLAMGKGQGLSFPSGGMRTCARRRKRSRPRRGHYSEQPGPTLSDGSGGMEWARGTCNNVTARQLASHGDGVHEGRHGGLIGAHGILARRKERGSGRLSSPKGMGWTRRCRTGSWPWRVGARQGQKQASV